MNRRKIVLNLLAGISMVFLAEKGIAQEAGKPKPVEAKIKQVTVYLDRAMVSRRLTTRLSGTSDKIIVGGLPVRLTDDTVRARIIGNDNIRLSGIEVQPYVVERVEKQRVKELEDQQRELAKQITEMSDRLSALNAEREFLMSLKASQSSSISSEISTDNPIDVEKWKDIAVFIRESLTENFIKTRKEESEKQEIENKKRIVDANLQRLSSMRSTVYKQVGLSVESKDGAVGHIDIEISYFIHNAGWAPSYDCYVDNESRDKGIELYYYGHVWQNTGEDWSDVELLLSTAHPDLPASMPELTALILDGNVSKELRDLQQSMDSVRYQREQLSKNIEWLERHRKKQANEQYFQEAQQAVSSIGAEGKSRERFATHVFKTPKKEFIPSDGSPHKTTIAVLNIPASFEYISTPKLSQNVYLKASSENNKDFPLLPGVFEIFLSNNYIGASAMKIAAPHEKFEIFLGVDEGIKVTRALEDKKDVMSTLRKLHYTYKTTIENLKKKTVKLTVIDHIPVSHDSDIEILLEPGSTPPDEQSKEGILKWSVELTSGEIEVIVLKYRVYFPSNKPVAGLD